MAAFQWQGQDLILNLKVQPGARKNEFTEKWGDDCYKVKITAPPVDGKANKQLCRFVAKSFGVPRKQVELISGQHSRLKRLKICNPRDFPFALE